MQTQNFDLFRRPFHDGARCGGTARAALYRAAPAQKSLIKMLRHQKQIQNFAARGMRLAHTILY